MSCRVYILSLLVPLDTLQVAYDRNCTRLFRCRMLYSTYVFHLLSVGSEKFVFNYVSICIYYTAFLQVLVACVSGLKRFFCLILFQTSG